MCVEVRDYVVAVRVRLPGAEPGGDAGRYADHSEHQRHRAGEVLAVPAVGPEQEGPEREVADRRELAIPVVGVQVGLDRADRVIRGARSGADAVGEPVHAHVSGVGEGLVGLSSGG